MIKGTIKQGDYVKHYSQSREVFKVMDASPHSVTLTDAEGKWFGSFPYDEVKKVKKVKTVKKWESA